MTFKLELNLFNEDKDLAKLEDLLNEFDIFKILAIQYKENNHSDLLAWLFNPKGNHHLETKFLKLFLKKIVELHGNDPRIPEIFADFTSETLRGVEVIRERENRIDIFIRNSKFVIVIENKIMAEENNDQLLNYFEYVEKTYFDRAKLYVFLSIDKEPNFAEDRENYITIKYKHLISILDDILLEIPHDETKYFILNFKKHIRRNLMPESENDYNLLCNEIYLKHRNAIQNIYIEKERRIKIIGDLIGNYFINSENFVKLKSEKNYIRFVTKNIDLILDELNIPVADKFKNNFDKFFSFEIENNELGLRLFFTIFPVDPTYQDIKSRLCSDAFNYTQNLTIQDIFNNFNEYANSQYVHLYRDKEPWLKYENYILLNETDFLEKVKAYFDANTEKLKKYEQFLNEFKKKNKITV